MKFDPRRTLHLRGFDRRGAAAALYAATADGFKVSGVFRAADDFAVLVLFDADNRFEHHSMRYLPDPDLAGLALEFDLRYDGLQPIDSPKFESIPWGSLSYIPWGGEPQVLNLFHNADVRLVGGDFSAAEGVFNFVDGGIQPFDRVTLVYQNIAFDYIAPETLSTTPLDDAVAALENQINSFSWITAGPPLGLRAERDGARLTVRAARYGAVNVSGTTVDLAAGQNFTGLTAPTTILINGAPHAVASVDSATRLTLLEDAGALSGALYLADRGGRDGNMIRLYRLAKNANLTAAEEVVQLSGGSSDAVWRTRIDFSALGIDQLRQAWLTLAPPLADSQEFTDVEWDAEFTNWKVLGPAEKRALKVAGALSARVNCQAQGVARIGSSWTSRFGFFDLGQACSASAFGDAARISYSCPRVHDLYIGLELSDAGASFAASLDGDPATAHTSRLAGQAPFVGLRKLRSDVAPGRHELLVSTDGNGQFTFDHVAAVVPADVRDPLDAFTDRSAALDYDTDATYKIPPQRLLFQFEKLGLLGDINLFEGNFFHYQRRKRPGTGRRAEYSVTFEGPWAAGDAVFMDIGGVVIGKSVFPTDDAETIARHFAFFINGAFVGVYAEHSGSTLTVKNRANLFAFDISTSVGPGGTVIESGDLRKGSEGLWEIDPDATPTLNYGARAWLADYLAAVAGAAMTTTVAYNLEGYNPPERPEAAWAARFFDGTPVRTAVGFGSEGEARVVAVAGASPVELEVPAHGFETGDSLIFEGFSLSGQPNADGSWRIEAVDADRFRVPSATGVEGFASSPADDRVCRRLLLTTHLAPGGPATEFLKRVYLDTADLMAAAGLTPRLQLGEHLWWFFSDRRRSISSVTASAPIRLWLGDHGLQTGDEALVTGVAGVPQANGNWRVTRVDENVVSLDGSDGSAAGQDTSSPQGLLDGGSMAFYDEGTKAAAAAALGRPLARFFHQDSDPAPFAADADFLRDRLQDHMEAIVAHVRAVHSDAVFELLYPHDVLDPDVFYSVQTPYPQGGRLNHHVSTPPLWKTPADGGRRLKLEALSWGSFYKNLDRARRAMSIWKGPEFVWPEDSVTYLLPWFNHGGPWEREYILALGNGPRTINFWALDHKRLFEWRDFPRPVRRAQFVG